MLPRYRKAGDMLVAPLLPTGATFNFVKLYGGLNAGLTA
jgi:hypothetical protein